MTETVSRIKVNPKVEPCARAYEVEAEIRANGGNYTAAEWEQTEHYESFATCWTRTSALRCAREYDADAIFGVAGYWKVARRRSDKEHDHDR